MERIAEVLKTRTFLLSEVEDEEVAVVLANLPYLEMMTIYLKVWKQQTWKTIAEHLDLSQGEVLELWARAREKLASSLMGYLPSPEQCGSRTPGGCTKP